MAKSKRDRTAVALRRARAIELRSAGWTWDAIAAELGHKTRAAAYQDAKRGLDAHVSETAAEHRALVVEMLDRLTREAVAILERPHVLVQSGRPVQVETPDGRKVTLHDDGPKLAAIEALRKLVADRRRLHGLDQPTKLDVQSEGTVRYEIVGVDLDKL